VNEYGGEISVLLFSFWLKCRLSVSSLTRVLVAFDSQKSVTNRINVATPEPIEAQLLEYNARFNLIAKENKKLEKKNAEIANTIKKSIDEYEQLQEQLREVKEKSDNATLARIQAVEQNHDLEEEIAHARNTLKELQILFKNAQGAAEIKKKKQTGRDLEFNKLLSQNKKLKGSMAELEWKVKEAETSLEQMSAAKDQAISRWQTQLSETNEIYLNSKEELVRIRHEKAKREREIEEWKERGRERIEQLHGQFDRKIEHYLDEAMRSKLSSNDFT
jgi:chromosome segregation ATPase